MHKILVDPRLIRFAFGWNYNAWSHPLLESPVLFSKRVPRILELGASRWSMVGLLFDGLADEIVVSYYENTQRRDVELYLSEVQKIYKLKSKYVVAKVDAKTVIGDFDIVIMKSVLGGLYRANRSSLADVKDFIVDLTNRAVNSGGVLISIDNGKSVFERFLSRLGARHNQWRFFRKSDLNFATTQHYFGIFSFFSFETRLGSLGFVVDNYIVYPLDYIFYKLWPHNPTVIVSIFDKAKKY